MRKERKKSFVSNEPMGLLALCLDCLLQSFLFLSFYFVFREILRSVLWQKTDNKGNRRGCNLCVCVCLRLFQTGGNWIWSYHNNVGLVYIYMQSNWYHIQDNAFVRSIIFFLAHNRESINIASFIADFCDGDSTMLKLLVIQ